MSRALEYLKTVPWAATPEAVHTICEIAARENLTVGAIELAKGEPLRHAHAVTVRGGVAIIPVTGPIFRRANLFTRFSGATSTEELAGDIGAALDDFAVRAILFDIDSPGGEVNGTSELAELIFATRSRKPSTAFVSGFGASAAYLIASAAGSVVVEKSSILGSVGAVIQVRDVSKSEESRGVRVKTVTSKQSPKKNLDPFTDEGAAAVQALLDSIADVMITSIARNRGTTPEDVLARFGQGGVLVGAAAVAAGMADGVGTLETVLVEIQEGLSRRTAGAPSPGFRRTTQEVQMADSKETPAAEQRPVVDRAFLAANHPQLVTALQAEGATAERDRILKIQALKGPDALKAECVKDPACSAGDAALKLNAAQAAADDERAKLHLKERTAAEGDLTAPPPSGDTAAAGDVQKMVVRSRALHEAITGAATPPARA